ncbi:MAG: DUF222 domain-containing protein [Geodermatophilaceae bacterium]|nr:DUF222 domain-containing protein [Geodermatophilaceae bacterium]
MVSGAEVPAVLNDDGLDGPPGTEAESGLSVAESLDWNPSFVAEWEAMSKAEYAASLRDIPDEVLDAAPADLPEDVRLALAEADAARLPDALSDPGGPVLAGTLAQTLAEMPDALTGTEVGADANAEVGVGIALADGSLIDAITGFGRQSSWAAAGQFRAVAELARRRVAVGGQEELAFVADEIALALTCSRYAAWSQLHTALDLVDRLPATLTALQTGRICPARVRVIAEGTRALSDEDAALVQDEVLAAAEVLTPSKLRPRVALAAAAVDPREEDEQHEDACAARTVRKYPREHGMTGIWALLPADHAAAVWAAINTHAETTRQTGDERTAEQRRADSLTDLATAYLDGTCPADQPGAGTDAGTTRPPATDPSQSHLIATAGAASAAEAPEDRCSDQPAGRRGCVLPGGHQAPRVPAWCRVQVKVSADWLLGRSTEAPTLAGHGPLPAEVALRLIADAGWQRIVYDPLTGVLLDVGSTVHDPPAALREHVLVRDGGCTQPICGNPRVDLDHNVPFPHGPTSADNLRSRCRHHHRLKQHPNWQASVRSDGWIEWITPTGHAYPEHPPDIRPGPTARPRAERPDETSDPPPF